MVDQVPAVEVLVVVAAAVVDSVNPQHQLVDSKWTLCTDKNKKNKGKKY